jgi:hypothetical protein
VLDWVCSGGGTRPADRFLGLADSAGVELWTVSGYARKTVAFAEASSPQVSASIMSAQTFGLTNNVDFVVRSIKVFDANSAGNELAGVPCTVSAQANGAAVVVRALNISML